MAWKIKQLEDKRHIIYSISLITVQTRERQQSQLYCSSYVLGSWTVCAWNWWTAPAGSVPGTRPHFSTTSPPARCSGRNETANPSQLAGIDETSAMNTKINPIFHFKLFSMRYSQIFSYYPVNQFYVMLLWLCAKNSSSVSNFKKLSGVYFFLLLNWWITVPVWSPV